MATPQEDFKQRLVAVVQNLSEAGTKDHEAMYLLGSLAATLIDKAKVANWNDLKASLSSEAYNSLLKTFQSRGNALVADGKTKAAYAVQALVVSLIARIQKDPDVARGEILLDRAINSAITFYRQSGRPIPPAN